MVVHLAAAAVAEVDVVVVAAAADVVVVVEAMEDTRPPPATSFHYHCPQQTWLNLLQLTWILDTELLPITRHM